MVSVPVGSVLPVTHRSCYSLFYVSYLSSFFLFATPLAGAVQTLEGSIDIRVEGLSSKSPKVLPPMDVYLGKQDERDLRKFFRMTVLPGKVSGGYRGYFLAPLQRLMVREDLVALIIFRNKQIELLPANNSRSSSTEMRLIDQNGKAMDATWFESEPVSLLPKGIPPFGPFAADLRAEFVINLTAQNGDIKEGPGYSPTGLINLWTQMNAAHGIASQYTNSESIEYHLKPLGSVSVLSVQNRPYAVFIPGTNRIEVAAMGQFDFSAPLHEFGHALFESQFGPVSYNDSRCKKHQVLAVGIDRQCAFIEGWATFYATIVSSVEGFQPDGVFQNSQFRLDLGLPTPYTICSGNDNPASCRLLYNFSESKKDYLDPNHEANTAVILWRLYKYGGIPLPAFLRAFSLMKERLNLTGSDLNLSSYLSCLRTTAFSFRGRSYSEHKTINIYDYSPADILGDFPEAKNIFIANSSDHICEVPDDDSDGIRH